MESVQFCDYSNDPVSEGFNHFWWGFGDGTQPVDTSDGCVYHQYTADGDYTVLHTVTTYDGRTASVNQTVQVRSHDVGIIKFTVPQTARAGQTRAITVGVKNTRYSETVIVDLYKSTPNGYAWVGSFQKEVPAKGGNRTTDFVFNYTFTAEDALMGKVTFRAIAGLLGSRDAFPGDNEAISLPVKVSK